MWWWARPCRSNSCERVPVQATEEQRVLALHIGEEFGASARMGGRHRELDQGCAERPDPAIVRRDRESRTPPQAGLGLMDAHGADDIVGDDAPERHGDNRDRDLVDLVAIVTREHALLFAEHFTTQASGAAALPVLGRVFHLETGGHERLERLEDHEASLRS